MSDKQTAIIIGIGPFVSRSLALYLASQDFRIGLITRKQSSLDSLAAEIRPKTEVFSVTADAGDPTALNSALDKLAVDLGKIDVLAYNAARVGADDILAVSPGTLEADFRTSALGTLVAGQWFIKHANTSRSIRPLLLITGGTLDRSPSPDHASLSAVKAAAQSLGVMFAQRLPETSGIMVGTPLIVEPIIQREGGGYQTKSDPDVIVQKIFKPYLDDRRERRYGKYWTVERIH